MVSDLHAAQEFAIAAFRMRVVKEVSATYPGFAFGMDLDDITVTENVLVSDREDSGPCLGIHCLVLQRVVRPAPVQPVVRIPSDAGLDAIWLVSTDMDGDATRLTVLNVDWLTRDPVPLEDGRQMMRGVAYPLHSAIHLTSAPQ